MQREIPALLRVFLWFVCLFAVTLQRDIRCSRGLIGSVQSLQGIAPTKLRCKLYTPTIQDFKICPGAALRCFAEELNVLIEEWGLNIKLSSRIKKLASFFNKTESACPQCEFRNTENAETFLGNLKTTLQNVNSQFCP